MQIEVFVEPNNKRCEVTTKFLDALGLSYTHSNLEQPQVREEFKLRLPDGASLPQIFIDGRHVGGLEDIVKILDSILPPDE